MTPRGAGALVVQRRSFLGLLAGPTAFVLGRFPGVAAGGSGRGRTVQPTAVNRSLDASMLLLLVIVRSLTLEGITDCAGSRRTRQSESHSA